MLSTAFFLFWIGKVYSKIRQEYLEVKNTLQQISTLSSSIAQSVNSLAPSNSKEGCVIPILEIIARCVGMETAKPSINSENANHFSRPIKVNVPEEIQPLCSVTSSNHHQQPQSECPMNHQKTAEEAAVVSATLDLAKGFVEALGLLRPNGEEHTSQ